MKHGKLPARGDGFAFQKNVAIAAAHTSGAIAHIMPKSLGDNKDVKAHHLLVLLLRLRQVKAFVDINAAMPYSSLNSIIVINLCIYVQ